ncbi:Hsp20/alpha crystallin family protein [Fructilactobacillus myrtifloralis]|uniref:Hsp20/alpha crystallin family protein n=1 Tax=Fructilactobacillus myrtifloralis TaxID=2940301 RepID=A0ABY5BPL7_9LACO|nr:Hsp20/alpha crystallin family protein [Fructilactobacillus myrtifloralis]USS84551.1 Hsp20/alpha crystallin family protein [Fructilactobacillus myrtifloralis]
MARNEIQNNGYNPLDDFFGNFGKSLLSSVAGDNRMKTDIIEHDQDFEVVVELPGFQKQDIHLTYDDGTLSIHATHDINAEVQNDDGRVLNQERRSMDVSRSFYLPDVDDQGISASYDGGLLKVILPKAPHDEGDNHQIEIN